MYDSSASSAAWAATLSASGTHSFATFTIDCSKSGDEGARTAHLSSTPPVSAALILASRRVDRDPELPDAFLPFRGSGPVNRVAPRVDRDGDRHVLHVELVDRLHAEVGEGEHARLAYRTGDEVRGAADRDQRDRLVALDRLDRRGTALALADHREESRLSQHGVDELVHARGGRRSGGAHDLVPHR